MKCLSLAWPAAVLLTNVLAAADAPAAFGSTTETVGQHPGVLETPVNQRVTPAGKLIDLPAVRPNALALSPNRELLVTSGLVHELLVLSPATGETLQRVAFPTGQAAEQASVSPLILSANKAPKLSFTGLTFSPDGARVYLADVNGAIRVFGVAKDKKVSALFSLGLPPSDAPARKAEIPAGLAVSADGKKLYVALNLSNRLVEMDASTGQVSRTWDVGVAPYAVVLAGKKLYVSNWGGRRPDAGSRTGPAGQGTFVRVDARSIADEGSVSVIDLGAKPDVRTAAAEILTGPRASALALSPNGRYLVCANAGNDTLSIIDTRTDQVVETLSARQTPADLFGAQPNALAFDAAGKTLYVCNGTQNAVAVFEFDPGDKESALRGLIPVGWFPAAIAFDSKRQQLCVTSLKGIASAKEKTKAPYGPVEATGFATRQYLGSLSLVPLPSKPELAAHTRTALANLRYPLLAQAALPARPGQPARPVPERVGEPSVFKHVIYVIKENHTYDQNFGDLPEGNGDPSLCVFGERITPNQHKLVREFVLLDNTYCCSILSADGHEWSTTGIVTDYVERSFAGWPRSYPAGNNTNEVDALAYAPSGFIWDNVLAHGKTLRDYGEFTITHKRWKDPARKGAPTFLDCYREFVNGTSTLDLGCIASVEPLKPHVVTNTVGWEMDVPDVWRAANFIRDLKKSEETGDFPNLTILWLPNDHTSGTKFGSPTPAAQVADNDLAFGRVVEAVSQSKFWKETCIIAIEDDPQSGWDHVSGYRTTAYVVSPYTKRKTVIHTQYNQTSVLRTIELMLGLPPMNQLDATATPMTDCFTDTPDFTPFVSVPNRVPLDEMNPNPKLVSDPQLRKDAYASAKLPLDQADQCPEDVLNRILWRSMKGVHVPYPVSTLRTVDKD
ncbi:MAG: bifunctional YncE family protein/alkaline phosphatase family protein [Verrucomicrobia bacterium]|nr:bifunctional YncE family protein/alkaline phosphatase family protein [Verrucomicrobiota bacterium]